MSTFNDTDLLLVSRGDDLYKSQVTSLKDYISDSLTLPKVLDDLEDVSIPDATALNDGDILTWDSTGNWVAGENVSSYLRTDGGNTFTGPGHFVVGDASNYILKVPSLPSGGNPPEQMLVNTWIYLGKDPALPRQAVHKKYVDDLVGALELSSLSDVDSSLSPTNGDFLQYNDVTSVWETGTLTLADLGLPDGTAIGDILVWDGATWDTTSFPIASDSVLGGIKVGTGLEIDTDGVLSTNISGALVFKGTCDITVSLASQPDGAIVTGDLSVGDTFINTALTGTTDTSWTGITAYVPEGQEMVTWTGSEWVISGRITSVNLNEFVRTSGDRMTGSLSISGHDVGSDDVGLVIEDSDGVNVTQLLGDEVVLFKNAIHIGYEDGDKSKGQVTYIQHYDRAGNIQYGATFKDFVTTFHGANQVYINHKVRDLLDGGVHPDSNQRNKLAINYEFLKSEGLVSDAADWTGFVAKSGDEMTGPLLLKKDASDSIALDPNTLRTSTKYLTVGDFGNNTSGNSYIHTNLSVQGPKYTNTSELIEIGKNREIVITDDKVTIGPSVDCSISKLVTVNRYSQFNCTIEATKNIIVGDKDDPDNNVTIDGSGIVVGDNITLDGNGITVNSNVIVDSNGNLTSIELEDLTDVTGAGSSGEEGYVLKVTGYDANGPTYGFEEDKGALTLDDLNDVEIGSAITEPSILVSDASGKFEPNPVPIAGQSSGVTVGSASNLGFVTVNNKVSIGGVEQDTNISIDPSTGIIYSSIGGGLTFKGTVDATNDKPNDVGFVIQAGDILVQVVKDPGAPVKTEWDGIGGVTVYGGEMISAYVDGGSIKFAIIGDAVQDDTEGFVRKQGDHMYGNLDFKVADNIGADVTAQINSATGNLQLSGDGSAGSGSITAAGAITSTDAISGATLTSTGLTKADSFEVTNASTLKGDVTIQDKNLSITKTSTGGNLTLGGKFTQTESNSAVSIASDYVTIGTNCGDGTGGKFTVNTYSQFDCKVKAVDIETNTLVINTSFTAPSIEIGDSNDTCTGTPAVFHVPVTSNCNLTVAPTAKLTAGAIVASGNFNLGTWKCFYLHSFW